MHVRTSTKGQSAKVEFRKKNCCLVTFICTNHHFPPFSVWFMFPERSRDEAETVVYDPTSVLCEQTNDLM